MNTPCNVNASPAWPLSLRAVFRADWIWCLFGALFSFVLASVLMSGWVLPNLDFPYGYSGDSSFGIWGVQRLIEGWIFDNPRSGYPFGSNFLDYPSSDAGNFFMLKILGVLGGSSSASVNLYFLLGFSATFVSSFCVFRAIGLNLPFALSATLLFNFQLFHFLRIGHLLYTWYFVIPLFYYIALRVYNYKACAQCTQKPNNMTLLFYTAGLLILSSFGVYYAFFGLIVIGTAILSMVIHQYYPAALKAGFFACAIITLGVLLNITPNKIHEKVEGINYGVAQRTPVESETYGFKFVQLALPRLGHRQPMLNKIALQYQQSFPLTNENVTASLGFFGFLGFVTLLFIILWTLSGRECDTRLKITALIVLILFMFGTIGGFGSLFALLIAPTIRGWNRISIFISFGALLGLFLSMQVLLQQRCSAKHLTYVSAALATVILLIGFYDQTSPACDPCNSNTKAVFNKERHFIESIENSLPPGSAIYQLPYMGFPEAPPILELDSYGLTAGFIHSKTLRWSFGGMKGRPGDLFYRALGEEPLSKQLEVIKKLNFAGIYIDCRAFEDNGKSIIEAWSHLLGAPPTLTADDGAAVFFRIQNNPNIQLEGLDAEQLINESGYYQDNLGKRYAATLQEGIDFRRGEFPSFVKSIQGLSGQESWGRWSDANIASAVRLRFSKPLPNEFSLVFTAIPFKPNTNKNLKIKIGTKTYLVNMEKGVHEYTLAVTLAGEQVSSIDFVPPKPTPPRNLGINSDKRKLGVGFINLRIDE